MSDMTHRGARRHAAPRSLRWHRRPRLRDQGAFTLIELLISSGMGITITLIAFSALHFVQLNVTKTDSQVHIDQAARGALTSIMLELHSGCIVPKATPVKEGSKETMIKFANARNEGIRNETGVQEAHIKPYLHEDTFEEGSEKLIEKKYEGEESPASSLEFKYKSTFTEKLLAKHVQRTWETTAHTSKLPVFRYYKYFEPGETGYEAGMLNPTPLATPLTAANAAKVAKVTVSFSVAPEEKTYNNKALEPLALEDSSVYRITPASTAESPAPQPCA
jgi:hypothetical protein